MDSIDAKFLETFRTAVDEAPLWNGPLGENTEQQHLDNMVDLQNRFEPFYQAADQFTNQDLAIAAQALIVSVNAAVQVKQAIVNGASMNSADLVAISAVNDAKSLIVEKYLS